MQISNEKINLFFDYVDKACMTLYNDIRIDYLEALIRVGNDIIFEVDDSKITDETYNELIEIYKEFVKNSFTNEEIRLALELLIIKGFKHRKLSLDIITPDTINYLLSIIVETKFKDRKSISILDTLLGTSNTLQTISNNISVKSNLIGIEKEDYFVKLAEVSSNLQNNEMKIYYQDALKEINDLVDIVIADFNNCEFDSQEYSSYLYDLGIRYFPYLVIEKRLDNIVDDGYFIFVIDNDFFSVEGNQEFRKYLEKQATLMSLIVLPQNIVREGCIGKSILIGKKAVLNNYHMSILNIERMDNDYIKDSVDKIKKLVKDI